MPRLTAEELMAFMHRAFPQARPSRFDLDSVEDGRVVFRFQPTEADQGRKPRSAAPPRRGRVPAAHRM